MLVVVLNGFHDLATPKNIVREDDTPRAHLRQDSFQVVQIILLIRIDKDQLNPIRKAEQDLQGRCEVLYNLGVIRALLKIFVLYRLVFLIRLYRMQYPFRRQTLC